jgi:hypothetical protein
MNPNHQGPKSAGPLISPLESAARGMARLYCRRFKWYGQRAARSSRFPRAQIYSLGYDRFFVVYSKSNGVHQSHLTTYHHPENMDSSSVLFSVVFLPITHYKD